MKITQEQQKKGQEFYSEIIAKAWEDKSFKKKLIENPQEAIKELTGENLDLLNKSIKVVDQSDPSTIFINIPQNINIDDFELTEEQLEMASGGLVVMAAIGLCALGVAAFGAGIALYAAVKN